VLGGVVLALTQILPAKAKPIIVTDAGFRGTWIKAVLSLQWDFVVRIRGTTLIADSAESPWFSCKKLMHRATARVKDFNAMCIIATQKISCRLCLVKKLSKGRHRKNIDGTTKKSKKSRANAGGAVEPWLIATSLKNCSAKTIVDYYAARMQIEESFRDTKNARYGLALRFTGTRITQRLTVLMLIAHIVMLTLYLIGCAAEAKKLHLTLQSNSVKKRRVLSPIYLGCLLVKCRKYKSLSLHEIKQAIRSILLVVINHSFT
jgi:hypothetical protein